MLRVKNQTVCITYNPFKASKTDTRNVSAGSKKRNERRIYTPESISTL